MPCVIGIIAAMLFFMERDNDTFKNLRTIPVTSTQMIFAKVIVLLSMGIVFSLCCGFMRRPGIRGKRGWLQIFRGASNGDLCHGRNAAVDRPGGVLQ